MSLTLENITLTYPDGGGRLTALEDVSLRVQPGELAAVVGPSGSGKSSLLAVAATLIAPDVGRVVLDGVDTGGLGAAALARLRRERIGIVFQQPNLLAALSVLDQLQVMTHLSGGSLPGSRARALDLLRSVGMAELADRKPHQLSGGQRQRVNIARALMNEPSVLLVDEPTSALDHERGAEIVDLVVTITRRHAAATVLVTHDTAHLAAADRVLECRDGRLLAGAAR
ncbi:MAG TPA: ABC transporter ATP-binding protein [Nocardioidaceae bacterium]|nr:ABC transporter ATP-binding protein [Nocardioidaceae bacterium]